MLVLHGTAFGLFLFGTIIYTLSLIANTAYPKNEVIDDIFFICYGIVTVLSFCSQCILCFIFVRMSRIKAAENPQATVQIQISIVEQATAKPP
jgi:hypothetical protein